MNYIVVPDGISASSQGLPRYKPSFVYTQVLDYTASICQPDDVVYLAPANACNGDTEHGLAQSYLFSKNKDIRTICPGIVSDAYVDTFGNASYLKDYLNEDLLSVEFELICAFLHSFRAGYCFKKNGYRISKIHRVQYSIYPEPICRRWWYYKYKPIHCVYEMIAYCRDVFKYRQC